MDFFQNSENNYKLIYDQLYHQYKDDFNSLKEIRNFIEQYKFNLDPVQFQQFDLEFDFVEKSLGHLESCYENLIYSDESNTIYENIDQSGDPLNTNGFIAYNTDQTNLNLVDSSNFELPTFDTIDILDIEEPLVSSEIKEGSFDCYFNKLNNENDLLDYIKTESAHQSSRKHKAKPRKEKTEDGLNTSTKLNKSKSKQQTNEKNTKGGLDNKKNRANDNRTWYKCAWESCSFGSYYNGVVKRHSYKRHSGKMKIDKSSNSSMHRFKCDWPECEVSLVAYHKLVEHKRKHTGEKPFRCKWKTCNYATARLYSMIIHERTHKLESSFVQ